MSGDHVGPLVLGIDTATPQVSVALGSPAGTLAAVQAAGGRRHGELVAPAVDQVCRLAGVRAADLDAVAVDVGPGLFTGLRVGVATGQALVSALGITGFGLTSLEVLAAAHHREWRHVAAVVDARRSEVFWARSVAGPAGREQVDPPAVGAPADVAAALAATGEPLLIVGDGAVRYRDAFAAVPGAEVAGSDDAHPAASVLVRLVVARLVAGIGPSPDGLQPLYLRAPDVRIGWASRPPAPSGPAHG